MHIHSSLLLAFTLPTRERRKSPCFGNCLPANISLPPRHGRPMRCSGNVDAGLGKSTNRSYTKLTVVWIARRRETEEQIWSESPADLKEAWRRGGGKTR
jgi:hypothetical protein